MDATRIETKPDVLGGKPVIRGTRLAVDFVLELLSNGWAIADIVDNYPGVQDDDVRACLAYASERLREEDILPLSA